MIDFNEDRANPTNTTAMDVQLVRDRLFDQTLLYLTVVLPLSGALSIIRAFYHGWQPIHYVHSFLITFFILCTFFRGRIPYRLRVWLQLGAFFLMGGSGLLAYGLVGNAVIGLFTLAILAAIAFGTRAGLILCAIDVIFILVVGVLAATKTITYHFPIDAYATSGIAWVVVTTFFFMCAPMVIIAIGVIHQHLVSSLQGSQENEKKYRQLFTEMHSAFSLCEIICDGNGNPVDYVCLEVNTAFERILAFSRDEVLGKRASAFFSGEELAKRIKLFGPVATTGKSADFETYSQRTKKHLEGHAYCPERGKFALMFTDVSARKEAETALLESEKRYRELVENAGISIFRTAKDGTIIEINPEFAHMFGYQSPEDLLSNVENTTALFANLRGREELFKPRSDISDNSRFEIELKRKNGSMFIGQLFSRVVRDTNGRVRFFEGFIMDITDRKRAERVLRESENRHKIIFEQAPLAISITDGMEIKYANPTYLKMFGFSDFAEVSALPPLDMFTPKWRPQILNNILLRSKGIAVPNAYEAECTRRDGTQFPVLMYFSRVTLPDGPVTLSFTLDISEKKRMEVALQESEERYRSMMEAMEDPIYICSPDFLIEYMNPAMIKWIGRDAAGELCHKAIHGADEKCSQCFQATVMQGGHITTNMVFADAKKTFNVSHSPIFHPDGSVSMLTVLRDVTEMKSLEKRMLQAQKMESIGNLASGIAHDFNNLLFPITGMAELLLEDIPPEHPNHDRIKAIFKAANRGADLVKQILSFSRKSDHKKVLVTIQPILEEVLKLSRSTIPSNIEIHSHIQSDRSMMMIADPTQLHQIAMNLITNSYHAIENTGGTISVWLEEAQLADDNWVENSLPPGQYAILTVSDTGGGIDPSIINRIFEPYFTTKPQGKGTGLGLSMVYGIVKEYGGDILVHSEPGEGTTFRVSLPLVRPTAEQTNSKVAATYATGTERLLLVDDEEAIVQLLTELFEGLGYRVTSHCSSIEALAAFKTNPAAFDFVFTDMTMPAMTGIELAEKLIAIRPDIPIVLCTGFNDKITDEKAKSIGIRGFLMKPVAKSDLARMVRKVLDEATGQNNNRTGGDSDGLA
jgi:PAS domain S-box-containing protein